MRGEKEGKMLYSRVKEGATVWEQTRRGDVRVKVGRFPAQHASIIKTSPLLQSLNNAESLLSACQRVGDMLAGPSVLRDHRTHWLSCSDGPSLTHSHTLGDARKQRDMRNYRVHKHRHGLYKETSLKFKHIFRHLSFVTYCHLPTDMDTCRDCKNEAWLPFFTQNLEPTCRFFQTVFNNMTSFFIASRWVCLSVFVCFTVDEQAKKQATV